MTEENEEHFNGEEHKRQRDLMNEQIMKSMMPDVWPEKDLVKPVLWEELEKRQFPDQKWMVKDLIPREGYVILAGISGEKKTWVAMEMAKAIVSGEYFTGDERFKIEQGNVLYIDMEMSQSELQRRGKQLNLPTQGEYKIHFISNCDFCLNGVDDKPSQVEYFKKYLKDQKISVVFVDTLRAVAGGLKEDRAEDVRMFFNQFKELKNGGVTIVWLDHFRKPNNFEGKIPKKEHLLGSQDKTAGVEILLMLKSEDGTDEIHVYQRKNRLGTEIKPFKIMMEDTETNGGRKTVLRYDGEIEEAERVKERIKEFVSELLKQGGKDTNEVLRASAETLRAGGKNTRAALRELVDDEVIQMRKEGKRNYYFLSEEKIEANRKDDFGNF